MQIVACQVLPSMGFSRQEYWSGLPFPSPGDLPNPEIEPGYPALQVDSLLSEPPGKPTQEDWTAVISVLSQDVAPDDYGEPEWLHNS